MKARELFSVALVIAGMVGAAALILAIAGALFHYVSQLAGVLFLVGAVVLIAAVWSGFARSRELAVEAYGAEDTYCPAVIELRRHRRA